MIEKRLIEVGEASERRGRRNKKETPYQLRYMRKINERSARSK
jgi:hypothetical protein